MQRLPHRAGEGLPLKLLKNKKAMDQNRNAAELQDALKLLADVSAYLKRLPHVPMTRELINRVDAYTADPQTHSAQRREAETIHETQMRHQARGAITRSPTLCLPVIELSVQGDVAWIGLGTDHVQHDLDGRMHRSLIDQAVKQLEAGVELVLKPETVTKLRRESVDRVPRSVQAPARDDRSAQQDPATQAKCYSAKLTAEQNAACAKIEEVTGLPPSNLKDLDAGTLSPKEFWRLNLMLAHDIYSAVERIDFPVDQ